MSINGIFGGDGLAQIIGHPKIDLPPHGRLIDADALILKVPDVVSYDIVGTLTIPTLKKRYKCEYCDTITEEPGNCKNCGAPVVEVKE